MRRKTLPLRTKALAVPQTTGTGWPLTSPTEGSPRPTKINPVRLLYASGRTGDVNLFFWDEGCSDGKPARGKPERPDSRRLLQSRRRAALRTKQTLDISSSLTQHSFAFTSRLFLHRGTSRQSGHSQAPHSFYPPRVFKPWKFSVKPVKRTTQRSSTIALTA